MVCYNVWSVEVQLKKMEKTEKCNGRKEEGPLFSTSFTVWERQQSLDRFPRQLILEP